MPKMKSKRCAAKRFRVTGSGKVKSGRANRRHLLSHKSRKRKLRLLGNTLVDETQQQQVQRMLPYAQP